MSRQIKTSTPWTGEVKYYAGNPYYEPSEAEIWSRAAELRQLNYEERKDENQ